MRNALIEAWKKPLSGNRVAISFLNRSETAQTVNAALKDVELDAGTKYKVYDVWKHATLGETNGSLLAKLKPHECQVFVLSPTAGK
jgi:alpha-galactosidase